MLAVLPEREIVADRNFTLSIVILVEALFRTGLVGAWIAVSAVGRSPKGHTERASVFDAAFGLAWELIAACASVPRALGRRQLANRKRSYRWARCALGLTLRSSPTRHPDQGREPPADAPSIEARRVAALEIALRF